MNFAEEFKDMKDILFTDDLAFENGDFTIAESDNQHTQHILIAQKENIKPLPSWGLVLNRCLTARSLWSFSLRRKRI